MSHKTDYIVQRIITKLRWIKHKQRCFLKRNSCSHRIAQTVEQLAIDIAVVATKHITHAHEQRQKQHHAHQNAFRLRFIAIVRQQIQQYHRKKHQYICKHISLSINEPIQKFHKKVTKNCSSPQIKISEYAIALLI